MNDLEKQINDLTREETLEAAQYLATKISGVHAPGERERELLQPFTDQPYANIEEIEQLARVLLLTAVNEDGYQDSVKVAIEGAGRKQLILGGAEIVALAGIGLIALHILMTKGKSAEEEAITIEEKDGRTTVSIKRKTNYGISGSLGKLLKSYFDQ